MAISTSNIYHCGSWTDVRSLWETIVKSKVKIFILNNYQNITNPPQDVVNQISNLITTLYNDFVSYVEEVLPSSLSANYDILFFEILKSLEARYKIIGNRLYDIELNTNTNEILIALLDYEYIRTKDEVFDKNKLYYVKVDEKYICKNITHGEVIPEEEIISIQDGTTSRVKSYYERIENNKSIIISIRDNRIYISER